MATVGGRLRWFFRIFSLAILMAGPWLLAEDEAARVIVLANRLDDDSLRVARHYAEVRGVPLANIISLPMPVTETITWPDFVGAIWEPLLAELVRDGWIDAIPMKLRDGLGRTKYAVSGHRIAYLVTCRGVPLRIMHDAQLYEAVAPYTNNAIFRINAGAVDAELSLLAQPGYAINAFVPNPLYHQDHPSPLEAAQVVRVSRLDGPTTADALALVDHAVAAEKTGLLGRAYIDIGGNHADGERWLETAAKELRELGFDTDVDRAGATIPATARFDAPVLYFGWYTDRLNGPFALPGFRFPPGAIALHIHSYSAATLRSADTGWCGPLIARGVTATVGNVFEPYLQFTHRPDLLLQALARGATWGEASAFAAPVLSWQAIAIGDPLYRPMAVSLDEQWTHRRELPPRLAGYAALRKMGALETAKRKDEALALARQAQREAPCLAVGLALAQRLQAAGDRKGAGEALGFVRFLQGFPTDEWALTRQAALTLVACDQPAMAVTVFKVLLRSPGLPRELRLAWLPDARAAALTARDASQAETWTREMTAVPPGGAAAAKRTP